MRLEVEGEDARIDSRYFVSDFRAGEYGLTVDYRMLKDDRVRQDKPKSIWDIANSTDNKLG